ncbi:hypothetical protein SCHPADRAFT_943036 [Schizopora paradoxa]|uniref:Uncharacterized protein n=1 Tax=Schizopora paradoxa TaxID=27342 RepID=A0A0H2REG8_9AGAM|nr:hypothetical protein SCHPADRAFT_943036 [Schizopora paradoxa]
MSSEVKDVQIPPRRSFKIMSKKIDYTFMNISEYRIRMRGHHKYLTVDASPFRENLLFQRLSDNYHIPQLLHDAQNNWTSAHITVRQDYYNSKLRMWPATPLFDITYSYRPLKTVRPIEDWDKPLFEVSNLVVYSDVSSDVQLVLHGGASTGLTLARYLPFESDMDQLSHELEVRRFLDDTKISPHFYGYIEEEERIIGFLHENTHTRRLLPEDVPKCKVVLEQLHAKGIALRNLSEDSFIFTADRVVLNDFSQAVLNAPKEDLEKEFEEFLHLFRDHVHLFAKQKEPSVQPMEIDSEEWNIVHHAEPGNSATEPESS